MTYLKLNGNALFEAFPRYDAAVWLRYALFTSWLTLKMAVSQATEVDL